MIHIRSYNKDSYHTNLSQLSNPTGRSTTTTTCQFPQNTKPIRHVKLVQISNEHFTIGNCNFGPSFKLFCCILWKLSQLVDPITLFIIITLTKQDENYTQHWVQAASNKEQILSPPRGTQKEFASSKLASTRVSGGTSLKKSIPGVGKPSSVQ